MARRRALSFPRYARKRWRLLGLTVVAILGTVLVAALTDEGHEPLWRSAVGDIQTLAISPDGSTAFAATRERNRITRLHAFDVATGDALWGDDVFLSEPATVAAGDGWFAIATPVPGARIGVYGARNGTELLSDFLDAEPRATAADGDRLAVALRTGIVHVLDDVRPSFSLVAPPGVSAFDAQGGRLAVGTTDGALVVWEGAREIVNVTRPFQIQSLRLSGDGTHLYAGGRAKGDATLAGVVELFDLTRAPVDEPAWRVELASRASFVEMDVAGSLALAVEETAPRYTLRAWDVATGAPLWAREIDGAIKRDDSGRVGGVALSADGRFVAAAPDLGGAILLFDAATGAELWTFEAEGAGAIAFPQRAGGNRFVAAARLTPGTSHDTLVGFDSEREPLSSDFPRLTSILVALELALCGAALGIGYWWYRRS